MSKPCWEEEWNRLPMIDDEFERIVFRGNATLSDIRTKPNRVGIFERAEDARLAACAPAMARLLLNYYEQGVCVDLGDEDAGPECPECRSQNTKVVRNMKEIVHNDQCALEAVLRSAGVVE